MDEVPVTRARFMTEADRRALALAENRLSDLSEWDPELLGAELEWLFEQDYDLDLTGFSIGDLDVQVGTAETAAEVPIELPDASADAVSRLGDLWQVGPHRLYCGNARDRESYETLLDGERATMVFADSPYNVPIAGNVSGLGQVQHREFLGGVHDLPSYRVSPLCRLLGRRLDPLPVHGLAARPRDDECR